MKTYFLAALVLTMGTSCEAKQPRWGERSFVLQNLRNWGDDAVVRSCHTADDRNIFLFQRVDEYFLITRNHGVFDMAFIDAKAEPIEIEANGGLGRYVEIQRQFESLRRFPGNTVGQSGYATYLRGAPPEQCNF